MIHYQQQLTDILSDQAGTIEQHILENGETVWVRKVGKVLPMWRYRLLGMITQIFHLGALQPVPNLGGQASIQIEAERLESLAQSGIIVPRLLAHISDGLMFSHLGEHTLLSYIENSPDRLNYFQQGLNAIQNVHASNQYLSQAFARNIIVTDNNEIGFIDFEDDPLAYLPLIRCQARDYLCYLHSTCLWLQNHHCIEEAQQIWQQHADTLPNEMVHLIKKSVKPILWMRHLHAKFWGSDTLRLAAMATLFHRK